VTLLGAGVGLFDPRFQSAYTQESRKSFVGLSIRLWAVRTFLPTGYQSSASMISIRNQVSEQGPEFSGRGQRQQTAFSDGDLAPKEAHNPSRSRCGLPPTAVADDCPRC
jgi:hypothetical protein